MHVEDSMESPLSPVFVRVALYERRGGTESRFLWDSDFYVMNYPRSRELLSRGRFTSRICYYRLRGRYKKRYLSWELYVSVFVCELIEMKLFAKDTFVVTFLATYRIKINLWNIYSRITLFRYKWYLMFLDRFSIFNILNWNVIWN